ncbi:HAD family hydrolase [Microvirga sp. VF16]|uniref:HAD-IIIC family phosphatase n=1 Tax=Microvirga sp. VF16 TaxID=2807101 RepID=UPI00193C90E3|nr:HAD-IIIC family phosphatase [Microvirga sp. VF16]QRM27261.1 HAD-IIIC family phosphatase [Microvirga sp. VF16]
MGSMLLTGDTTLSGIGRALQKQFGAKSSWIVKEANFNSWRIEAVDPQSSFHREPTDFLIYILSPRILTDLPDAENVFEEFLSGLQHLAGMTRVLCTTLVVDPFQVQPLYETLRLQKRADDINAKLRLFMEAHNWFNLIDQAALFMTHGIASLTDPRFEMLGRMYYSPKGVRLLGEAVERATLALTRPPKKVLVLDLDNTLWGGVLGEDGITGIRVGGEGLGYAFSRFQRTLETLKQNGILLAICSKNEEEDALRAIAQHPDMQLRINDFVTHRINWKPKSENLRSIAEELNLGLDSLVLFDDSPFECESIRQLLPDVDVLEAPKDPSDFVRALAVYPGFDMFRVTDEDRKRSHQYFQDRQRRSLASQMGSLEEVYRSLEMRGRVSVVTDVTLARVQQLIHKTNQFNLTTKRYQEPELLSMMASDDVIILTLHLSDRLGESGLTGVLVVTTGRDQWEVDNLLLSCRVIGRTVEYGLIRYLAEKAQASGARELIASFVPSGRNQVAAEFLSRAGFRKDEKTGRWILPLNQADTLIPKSYVSIEEDAY